MLRVNGFYGHVRQNDLRSFVMFAGFIVAFQIIAAVALFPLLLFVDMKHAPFFSFGYVERYVPLVLVASAVLFFVRFYRHVSSMQATVSFAYVDRRTDPRLVNTIETLAIEAGLPLPRVGIIETPACNAFACGLSASSAVIVVTRGLLDALDDDELAAVAAHEIAHIRNGDIRLMAAAKVLMENLDWLQRKNLLRGIGWKMALVVTLMPALLVLFAMAGFLTKVAFTIARVSRLLISSSREFMADAEAVRLTHNPAALISALRRIEGRSALPNLSPQADAMMIDGAVEGPLATHPTIAERIAVLARLSGKWAESAAPRKDTRAATAVATGLPHNTGKAGPWGGTIVASGSSQPARFLYQRVNAGVTGNIYGMTKSAKWVIGIGFAVLVGSTFLTIGRFDRAQQQGDAERRRAILNTVGADVKASVTSDPAAVRAIGAAIRAETQRLSKLDPRDAGCFATPHYWVGDRGLHPLKHLDPRLVEAYARPGSRESSGIVLEQFFGWRLQTVRAVASAPEGDLDTRLISYVKTRKTAHEVAHRFFGAAGLNMVHEAYTSPEDRAVIEMLRGRSENDDHGLTTDAGFAAEIRLLINAPETFIPCVARAASNYVVIPR